VGERRGVNRALLGKPEKKRPPERSRRRRKGNIMRELQKVR